MPTPLITLADARVTLAGRRVLDELNWALDSDEHWAVLGANGAGKSTFLRLIRGEQWPDQRLDAPAQITWNLDHQEQTTPIGIRQRMPLISAEAQDRYLRRDWRVRVEDLVLTGFQDATYAYRPPTDAERANAEEVLARLGLVDLRQRSILELSTGQARKALMARALAAKPQVLLLDEAAEGLDAAARTEILEAVDTAADMGTRILFATHRPDELGELPRCLTKALWLHAGRIAWQGPLNQVDQAPGNVPAIAAPDKTGQIRKLWRGVSRPDGPLLKLEQVNVFIEGHQVLHELTWTAQPGQHWAVLGANGSGKTSLLRLLAGELAPALGGYIQRLGLDEPVHMETLRQGLGRVSAELQANMGPGLGYDLPARLLVATGFYGDIGLFHEPTGDQLRAADAWLDFLSLAPLAERSIRSLSYGQMRRLLLARALVHSPRLLLLDEPCSGLDTPSRQAFLAALRNVAGLTTLIYVTHHDEEIIPEIQNLLVLKQGRVTYVGPRNAAHS